MSTITNTNTAATCARHKVTLVMRLSNDGGALMWTCPACDAEHNPRLTAPSGRCECPTCTVSKSLRALDEATEAWLNREEELGMSHAWLVDEIKEILLDPKLPVTYRRRLTRALEIAS